MADCSPISSLPPELLFAWRLVNRTLSLTRLRWSPRVQATAARGPTLPHVRLTPE
jgi:hypothetical protein